MLATVAGRREEGTKCWDGCLVARNLSFGTEEEDRNDSRSHGGWSRKSLKSSWHFFYFLSFPLQCNFVRRILDTHVSLVE
mmetsp:Transcript_20389/g.28668  ORF Transcript_20389/g.28668 Transcript_20389/m.28668 type:complete len:80 (-) Transcript_20389:2043-2282(-)